MSLQVPTTAQTNASIISQLEAKFSQTIPIFPRAFLRMIAKILAGVTTISYKYAGFIFLQMFVDFASTKETTINGKKVIPLVQWGRLVGIGDPTAAVRAEYTITLTVTDATGTLAAGQQLFSATNGVTYLTLASVDLTQAPPVQVTVRAVRDQSGGGGRGTIGNLAIGDILSFVNPQAKVAADATIAAEVTTGVDAESWDVYRQRVKDRFRQTPQGGALVDYEGWAESVAGIVNAYVYTGDPGVVEVYTEADTTIDADGIPTTALLTAVKNAIDLDVSGLATRRPISSYVESKAITRVSFTVQVVDLSVETDLSAVQTKIREAVQQYFLARAPYVPGQTLGARRDRITKSGVGGVVQDVVEAFNGIFGDVAFFDASEAYLDFYVLGKGEKAKAANVYFV